MSEKLFHIEVSATVPHYMTDTHFEFCRGTTSNVCLFKRHKQSRWQKFGRSAVGLATCCNCLGLRCKCATCDVPFTVPHVQSSKVPGHRLQASNLTQLKDSEILNFEGCKVPSSKSQRLIELLGCKVFSNFKFAGFQASRMPRFQAGS